MAWRGHVGIVVNPAQHVFYSAMRSGAGIDTHDAPYWKPRGSVRFYRYIKSSRTSSRNRFVTTGEHEQTLAGVINPRTLRQISVLAVCGKMAPWVFRHDPDSSHTELHNTTKFCTDEPVDPAPYNLSAMGDSLKVERLGNIKNQTVLCFKGPLTVENVSAFQNAIRREESFSSVILDFSDVPYIDSTALGALVSTYVSRQKLGRRVVLCGISERITNMLKITNVESFFLTFPTLEEAISGLTRAGAA